MSLPPLRWVSPPLLALLRAIDRSLSRDESVTAGLDGRLVVWRRDGIEVARACLPPGGIAPVGGLQLELTLMLPHRDGSKRWSDVAALRPGRFAHHLRVYGSADIDFEVERWLVLALRAGCAATMV